MEKTEKDVSYLNSECKRFRFRIVVPAYPALNIYTRIAKKTTALGPLCVATSVNKMPGWDAEVIDENNLGKYGPRAESGGADHRRLQVERPADVVGFYAGLSSTAPRVYEIAKIYKTLGVITIAGGQHFCEGTIGEALASGIDYVILGEGEEAVSEFLKTMEGGGDIEQVKGLAYLKNGKPFYTEKREAITDFEKLADPDFSLVRYANMEIYPLERIRGCGMNCEFCTVKGKPRAASPERMLRQVSSLVENRGAKEFFIVDDLFGQHRDETIRLCNMLGDYQRRIGRRLCITVQIRLDKARDEELLSAMRSAGIKFICIGYESPIEEELAAMDKRIKAADMMKLTEIYRKAGFIVHGMFIFAYPLGEKSEFQMSADERVAIYRRFIKKAKIDTVQIMLPVPLPGTEFRERLEKGKRIFPLSDIGWEYYDGSFPLFEPDMPLTPQELHYAAKNIMGKFYRFSYMFLIPVNILEFPSLIFYFNNIQAGWSRWYRLWRNNLIRSGGSIMYYKWSAAFKKNNFLERLREAQLHLSGLHQYAGEEAES